MSCASRTNDNATKSMPSAMPTSVSARSLAVKEGRLTLTPGRLMCRREVREPGVSTRQRMWA
jgi:hypothetical protein